MQFAPASRASMGVDILALLACDAQSEAVSTTRSHVSTSEPSDYSLEPVSLGDAQSSVRPLDTSEPGASDRADSPAKILARIEAQVTEIDTRLSEVKVALAELQTVLGRSLAQRDGPSKTEVMRPMALGHSDVEGQVQNTVGPDEVHKDYLAMSLPDFAAERQVPLRVRVGIARAIGRGALEFRTVGECLAIPRSRAVAQLRTCHGVTSSEAQTLRDSMESLTKHHGAYGLGDDRAGRYADGSITGARQPSSTRVRNGSDNDRTRTLTELLEELL